MLWAESPQSTCSVTREVQVQAVFGVCLPSPSVATPIRAVTSIQTFSGFRLSPGPLLDLCPSSSPFAQMSESFFQMSCTSRDPCSPASGPPEGGWEEGRTGCPFLPHSALVSVSNLGYIISAILIPLEVPGHSPSSQGALALARGTHLHPVPLLRPPCQSPGGLQFL